MRSARHAQVLGHEIGVVAIHGHQCRQIAAARRAARPGPRRVVRLGELFEKDVLARKRAHDRHVQPLRRAAGPCRPASRWTSGSVAGRTSRCSQSMSLSSSLRCRPSSPRSTETVSAAERFGPGSRPAPRDPTQQTRMVQQSRQARGAWRNRGRPLLQKDVDPAERHAVDADVGFVGAKRRVERRQQDVGAATRRAAASVLPCRQLPQYMSPAPAIRWTILIPR